MNRTDFHRWYKLAVAKYPGINEHFTRDGREEDRVSNWMQALASTDVEDAVACIEDMFLGRIEAPRYVDDWSRLPSIVRAHAGKAAFARRQEEEATTRRTEYDKSKRGRKGFEFGGDVQLQTWLQQNIALMTKTGQNERVCMWRLGFTQALSPDELKPNDYPEEWPEPTEVATELVTDV